MNVGVFHCFAGVGSAWGCAEGISRTLTKLGAKVLDLGHPLKSAATVDDLNSLDLLILSAPEWYFADYERKYESQGLSSRMLKVAWHAESAYRDDQNFNLNFGYIRSRVDKAFYPAIQDAEEFDGNYLPFGVDIDIFYPKPIDKQFDCAFLGTLYPKRQQFIKDIGYPITYIQPINERSPEESFGMVAAAYSTTRIFLNLPALSRLLVTKVTEVMACNTLLLQPRLDHTSALRNEAPFLDGVDLVYYDPKNPKSLGDKIKDLLENPEEIKRIANSGYKKTKENYSLEIQVKKLLSECNFTI